MCKKYQDAIVITNRKLVDGDFKVQLEKVLQLHPFALILREKDLADSEYELLAKDVKELCHKHQVNFFVHSRVNVAKSIECKKIHFSIYALKEAVEKEETYLQSLESISVSCHSMEDVKEAETLGATQIVLGTIFETECKKGLKGKGISFVEEICNECKLPVFAIGGMNLERIKEVQAVGAKGGCMMSSFMQMK